MGRKSALPVAANEASTSLKYNLLIFPTLHRSIKLEKQKEREVNEHGSLAPKGEEEAKTAKAIALTAKRPNIAIKYQRKKGGEAMQAPDDGNDGCLLNAFKANP